MDRILYPRRPRRAPAVSTWISPQGPREREKKEKRGREREKRGAGEEGKRGGKEEEERNEREEENIERKERVRHELITYCSQDFFFDKQESGGDIIETAGSKCKYTVPK